MVKINLIDGPLYQWDTGRKVRITTDSGVACNLVHFSNGKAADLHTDDDGVTADISNVLLQTAGKFTVYAVVSSEDGIQTLHHAAFYVREKEKPDDYAYTETEVRTWDALDRRLKVVEEAPLLVIVNERIDMASRTSAEIYDWAQSGRLVVALCEGHYYYLNDYSEEIACFYWLSDDGFIYLMYIGAQRDVYIQERQLFYRDNAVDFITRPTKATVNQAIVVKSVDSTGKPTAWKCVDLPLVAKFETSGDHLICTTHSADQLLNALSEGTPVFANVYDENWEQRHSCGVHFDGQGSNSRIVVGYLVGSDSGWQHHFGSADCYVDGDASYRGEIGKEYWIEY